MAAFTVRTAEQLPAMLKGFRKQSGLTQAETAMRLGVSQQALSNLERHADKVSAERLLELLSILGVELVLRKTSESPSPKASVGPSW